MQKVQIDKVYTILKKEVQNYRAPVVDLIQLQTKNPFNVLIATILSARTKDQTTVAACKKLFAKVKTFSDIENISEKQVQKLIYPVGFYQNKAKYLKQLPKAVREKFNDKIPQTIDQLIQLPGVGRKTANLVVAIAFQKPAVCVDVHVHRITNRLGYLRTKIPFETEMTLRKKLPKKYWTTFNSIFVAFGQFTCKPISPFCSRCPVQKYCNRVGVKKSR